MFYQATNQQAFLVFIFILALLIALVLLGKAIIEEKRDANIEQEFLIISLCVLIVFILVFIIGLIGIMV